MNIRAASLFVAFTFAALPAQAQGPGGPPPNYQQLASQLAALTAHVTTLQGQVDTLQGQVAKLEGNITAADLVGTYTLWGIQTRLRGGADAGIGSAALTGNMVLNSNATASLTVNGDGSLLTVLGWTLAPSTLGNGNPGSTFNFTWAYANGALTLIPPGGGGEGPGIPVGPAGRLLIVSVPEFHVAESTADVSLLIFYRLQ
jgi:hypothetical protein